MSSSSPEIVITSSPDGPITAYDTVSGTTLACFTGSRSPRHGLALAGNAYVAASHISSSTASGSIHLYNWWSPTALHHLPVPEPVAPLAATPDGLYLFAGGLSGSVYSLTIPSGSILRSFPAHDKPVSSLRINSDWSLVISGGDDDCTCKLWSLLEGTNLQTVAFPCVISSIALDTTEAEFYAAGSDGLIYKGFLKVGSTKEANQSRELVTWAEKHGGAVVSVVVVNEGKNLVSAAEDGSIYIWEIERGQVLMVLGNDMEGISDVVVAKGISDGKAYGLRIGNDMNEFGGGNLGLSGKELSSKPIKDTMGVEDVLTVAASDRRKAIDMLESAIRVYERLLELILKEAKGCASKNGETEEDDM
ncbi:hypothetical protein GH714_011026 [Hevea brasiliensis]|uniref:Anaphase-promoting complex subunit 4 WD40 domain-containing protein n=1 Tax=Hevea brasiliensis TaxID=3981 RepID=A0A6A6KCK2_HEVBR|nr:hypothetical protein GH714_011026 [Hevea brasiliensis]